MPTIQSDHREIASDIAEDFWDHFIDGSKSIDRRIINEHLALLVEDMTDCLIPWEITTSRYNERLITVDEYGDPHTIGSFGYDLSKVCYNANHYDKAAFMDEVSSWILSKAYRLAEEQESKADRAFTLEAERNVAQT